MCQKIFITLILASSLCLPYKASSQSNTLDFNKLLDETKDNAERDLVLDIAALLSRDVLYPEPGRGPFYIQAGDYLSRRGYKQYAADCYDLAAGLGMTEGFLKKADVLPKDDKRKEWLNQLGSCKSNNAKKLIEVLRNSRTDLFSAVVVHSNLGYYHLNHLPDPLLTFKLPDNPKDFFQLTGGNEDLLFHAAEQYEEAGRLLDAGRLYSVLADSCNVDAIAKTTHFWNYGSDRTLLGLVWGNYLSQGYIEKKKGEKESDTMLLANRAWCYLAYLKGEDLTSEQWSYASHFFSLPEERLLRHACVGYANGITSLLNNKKGYKFAYNAVQEALDYRMKNKSDNPYTQKEYDKIIERLKAVPVDYQREFKRENSKYYPYYASGFLGKAHKAKKEGPFLFPVGVCELDYTPPLVPDTDIEDGELTLVSQMGHMAKKCTISPSGKYALTTDMSTSALLWDISSGRILKRYNRKYPHVLFLQGFPEYTAYIDSDGFGGGRTVYDLRMTGLGKKSLVGIADYDYFNKGYNPLFRGECDKNGSAEVIIRNTTDNSISGVLKGKFVQTAGNIEISPDGKRLLVGGHYPYFWDLDKWEILDTIPLFSHMMRDGLMVMRGNEMPLTKNSILNGTRPLKDFFEGHYLPDGNLSFGTSRGEPTIWSSDGDLLEVLQVEDPIVYKLQQCKGTLFGISNDGQLLWGKKGKLDNVTQLPIRPFSIKDILFFPDRDEFYLAASVNGNTAMGPLPPKKTIDFSRTREPIVEFGLYRGRISNPGAELECIITTYNDKTDYGGGFSLCRIGNTPNILMTSYYYATIYNCATHHETRLRARFEGFITASCVLSDGRIILGSENGWLSVFDRPILPSSKERCRVERRTVHSQSIERDVLVQDVMVEGNTQLSSDAHFCGEGKIRGIVEDTNRGLLYVSSWSGAIKIYRLNSFELVATAYSLANNNHLLFTPDGYYMCNKESSEIIMYSSGLKLYGFEQFDLVRNRPDIVLERLGAPKDYVNSLRQIHAKRQRRMRLSKLDGNTTDAPSLRIVLKPERKINIPEARIVIAASDRNVPLSSILVWVNGAPVYGQAGYRLDQNKTEVIQSITIPLADGNNQIELSCLNAAGVESLRQSLSITYEGPDRSHNLFLIGIGVSQYKEPSYNLRYAAKDAQEIIHSLKQAAHSFDKINTLLLTDSEVNQESLDKIRQFLKNADSNDAVIAFYAGHGVLDKEYDYYLTTPETDFLHPASNSIAYTDFEDLFDGIKPQKRLIMIDACHAGEIDKEDIHQMQTSATKQGKVYFRGTSLGTESPESIALENGFMDIRRGRGTTVLAGSSGLEVAMEGNEWKNGLFTWVVKNAIIEFKADINNDGKVSLSELLNYTRKEVKHMSGGLQSPNLRSINKRMDFFIAER